MFEKRALSVQFVKAPKPENSDPETVFAPDPKEIAEITKDVVTHTAIAVGSVIALKSILTTVGNVAIAIATKR